MPATLAIRDETTTGSLVHAFTLDFLTEEITVRELIERRVYEEVQEYNRSKPTHFRGLVQPVDAEETLNGYRLREPRRVDAEQQYDRAIGAFDRNGFVVLVDDRQVEALDDEITLTSSSSVSFLKLVPLVGG